MWDKVLLLPNFQRSSGFLSPPRFKRECKGKGLFISTKFFSAFFLKKSELNGVKINLFYEELFVFFWDGRQRYNIFNYQPILIISFIHIRLIFAAVTFREHIRFERGCKAKDFLFISQFYFAFLPDLTFFVLQRTYRFLQAGCKDRMEIIPAKSFLILKLLNSVNPLPDGVSGLQFFLLLELNAFKTLLPPGKARGPAPRNSLLYNPLLQ